jgi:hypothetical protein
MILDSLQNSKSCRVGIAHQNPTLRIFQKSNRNSIGRREITKMCEKNSEGRGQKEPTLKGLRWKQDVLYLSASSLSIIIDFDWALNPELKFLICSLSL